MAGRQSPALVAARMLAWLQERSPFAADGPTPVDELAVQLGLAITAFAPEMIPGALGYLEPGEDVIFVRTGLSEAVRRFTLAHELGHAALHRRAGLAAEVAAAGGDDSDDSALIGCDDFDLKTPAGEDDETLRPGQAYSMRAQREGEANAFAAALLLPATATLDAYEAICAHDVERPALALAQRFGVSEDAALRRLAALLTPARDEPNAPIEPALQATLDSDQRRAARAETPALVLAGPGSGKTSALLARIAYLLDERGVAPERILALTFSRKAADELRSRLTPLLGARSVEPRVSTIHAFCGDTLRRYGWQVGLRPDYRLITRVEGYFLLRRIVNRTPLAHYTPLSGPTMHFGDLLNAISRFKDDLISPDAYREAAEAMTRDATAPDAREKAENANEVATVYSAYQEALEARGDVDYGDLIVKMERLLREAPETAEDLRQRYEHILVDEFQDINHAMGVLLRELAGPRGALWAVGDVDQAIYRFRGASPANLLGFTHDFEGAQVIPLGRNYRSRPLIVRAASAFASAYLPGDARVTLEATREETPDQPAVTLAVAPDGEAELDGLARAMRERLSAGISLREQAVLLRTRDHVRQVCEGLRARGIPARIARPVLDEPLIKTLLATVGLTVDALGSGLLRAGDQLDHAFSDEDVRALLRVAHELRLPPIEAIDTREAQVALTSSGATVLRRLARIVAELRSAPTVALGMSRYIFSLTMLGRRLLHGDAHAEAAQVARLLEICRAFDDQRAAGALLGADESAPDVADWKGMLDYMSALRELGLDPGVGESVDDEDAVLVMTAHAGKGLEFPVVYLPLLVNRRFPLSRHAESVPPPPGLLRQAEHDDDAHLHEEANLFYVSLTRARDTLALSYARRYGKGAYKASPFLAPIEDELGAELPRLRWEGDAKPTAPDANDSAADVMQEGDTQEGDTQEGDTQEGDTQEGDTQMAERVVSLNQLETYLRCPQQYAYQYVYRLQPALAAPVSLRSAYTAASAEVRSRFVTGTPPTLEEALAFFGERWRAARAEALGLNGATTPEEGDETFSPVYRLHGERAIERLWHTLSNGEGGAANAPDDPLGTGAPLPTSVSFGGATITGTLDHVAGAPSPAPEPHGASVNQSARSTSRIARYKHGKLGGTLTPRDLFYALAAEQIWPDGQRAEVVHVSLANGDVKPLKIDGQRERLEREASEALAGLARESYPPQPSARACASCPFALICPA